MERRESEMCFSVGMGGERDKYKQKERGGERRGGRDEKKKKYIKKDDKVIYNC